MRHAGIGALKELGGTDDDQISPRSNAGACREIILDASANFPSRERCRARTLVVQLNELSVDLIRDGIRHDLIDDDVGVWSDTVRCILRGRGGGIPFRSCLENLPSWRRLGHGRIDRLQRRAANHALPFSHSQNVVVQITQIDGHIAAAIRGEIHRLAGIAVASHHAGERYSIGKIRKRGKIQTRQVLGRRCEILHLHPIDMTVGIEMRFTQPDGSPSRCDAAIGRACRWIGE